jgi:hypothetical protein
MQIACRPPFDLKWRDVASRFRSGSKIKGKRKKHVKSSWDSDYPRHREKELDN